MTEKTPSTKKKKMNENKANIKCTAISCRLADDVRSSSAFKINQTDKNSAPGNHIHKLCKASNVTESDQKFSRKTHKMPMKCLEY